MVKKALKIVAAVGMLGFSAFPAFAGFFPDTYGAGIREMSMGNAFTAIADDYSATFYNPAGLAQKSETTLAFNYIQPFHKIDVSFLDTGEDMVFYDSRGRVSNDPTRSADGESLNVSYPILGVKLDINRLVSSIIDIPINVQMGAIVSLPKNFSAAFTLHTPPPDFPQFIRIGDDLERVMINIGLGLEIKKDLLYVGWGFILGIEVDGPVHLKMTLGDELEDRYLSIQLDIYAMTHLSHQFGVLFTPFDKKVKIGASYTEENYLKVGYLEIEAEIVGSLEVYWDCYTDFLVGYNPKQYRIGFAYMFDCLTISMDSVFQKWSDYSYTKTFSIAYSPDNPNDFLRGYEAGSPDFNDTWNLCLGAEYIFNRKLTFTAGYRHMPSPVPDQSYRVSNYMDFDKDIFSVGVNYRLNNYTKIGALFQYMMLEDYKVYKNGDEKGHAWINQRSYEVKGDIFVCGISVEFTL